MVSPRYFAFLSNDCLQLCYVYVIVMDEGVQFVSSPYDLTLSALNCI